MFCQEEKTWEYLMNKKKIFFSSRLLFSNLNLNFLVYGDWWAQQTIFLITLDSAVSIGAPVSIDSPNSDIRGIMSNITFYVKHTKYVALRLTRYKRKAQTSTCQGHLHGIGYLLLLCHAAEVWQCCHTTLRLRGRHLQKSFLWFWGENKSDSGMGINFKEKRNRLHKSINWFSILK